MKLNSTAVDGSTLHMAYVAWNYPYLYETGLFNKKVGFLSRMWNFFYWDVDYVQYPFESASLPYCNGILKPVYDGIALTAAGATTPNALRSKLFRISSPVYYTSFDFYEAARGQEDTTELVFFTVFSISTLVLLISLELIAYFISLLISSLRKINNERKVERHTAAEIISVLSKVIYMCGITIAVYYHNAGFKGNSVIYTTGTVTTFSEMIDGFHAGTLSLVSTSASSFDSVKKRALQGDSNIQFLVETDQIAIMQMLCDNPKLIAMVERNAISAMSLADRPCKVNKIKVPPNISGLEVFGERMMQNYFLSRNYTSRRSVKRINDVLLKIFPQDMIEGFWTRRYGKSPKYSPDNVEVDNSFKPMNLRRLQLLFYFTVPGIILSVFMLLVELHICGSCVDPLFRSFIKANE